ncbi:MAG: hypothetical protein D6826_00775 [Alphaproteobacteria bacterium]|nr:MAG: hypothetical protein D6826_00775 [Alphaproteobacteria bacterium]
MLAAICTLVLAFYLIFLVDWPVFRSAFAKGGIVALAIYVAIGVGYWAAKANHVIAAAGLSGHHG